jgi:hypothetical protein
MDRALGYVETGPDTGSTVQYLKCSVMICFVTYFFHLCYVRKNIIFLLRQRIGLFRDRVVHGILKIFADLQFAD